MLKALYVIAIGLLFAGLVGFGFAAFYQAPDAPELKSEVRYDKVDTERTPAEQKDIDEYEAAQEAYQKKSSDYNRNLSIGLIIAALATMAISLMGLGKLEVIGDGITLGGVFTLLYGLGRAMAVENDQVRFIAVAVGLVVLLFLTYWKFIRGQTMSSDV